MPVRQQFTPARSSGGWCNCCCVRSLLIGECLFRVHGQLQLIGVILLNNTTQFGSAGWQLALMCSSQLTGFRLGAKARTQRDSTGNLIGYA
jgi:hypothetical protein